MNTFLNFMKRNYKIIALVLVASLALWSFIPKQKGDPKKDRLLLELLTFVIEKGHYSPAEIDDNFSKSLYKEYIKSLDPTKRFFLQSDIEEFSKYETSTLDVIQSSEKSTSFEISFSFLSKLIFKLASKLDPISLLALFSSMLILQTFLILRSSNHF